MADLAVAPLSGAFPLSGEAFSLRPNARLYLLNTITSGPASGVCRLLINFYVLSLGDDEALRG